MPPPRVHVVPEEALDIAPSPEFQFPEKIDYELVRNWAKLSVESFADRLDRYIEYFTPSVYVLRQVTEAFVHELELGLEAHRQHPHVWIPEECSFKMLDACVENLPTGDETAISYALDFGGTNFRVVRVNMLGGGHLEIEDHKQSLVESTATQKIPRGLMDARATATQMFDFFAASCMQLIRRSHDDERADLATPLNAGFCFSFPCVQRSISSATCIEWTKGFETGRKTNDPVEGLDVAELMNAAFHRFKVPLQVSAVVNDTVGTLLAGRYEMDQSKPRCLIGLILGTGVNACYYEREAPSYNYCGHIINIECGNFNRSLPLTNVDLELDFAEVSNRGKQRLEKMVAGAYLGEIARRVIVKVLQSRAPLAAWAPYSLRSESLTAVVEDQTPDLATAASVLSDTWNHDFDGSDLEAIYRLCVVVVDRAAALAAVLIAGVARKTGFLQPAMMGCTVAIDGSLYKQVAFVRQRIRFYLEAILGRSIAELIDLIEADDGSGKGAAILAGTV